MPGHAGCALHGGALAVGHLHWLIAQQDIGKRQGEHHHPDDPAQYLPHSNLLQGIIPERPNYFQVAVEADGAHQEDADVHGGVEEDC